MQYLNLNLRTNSTEHCISAFSALIIVPPRTLHIQNHSANAHVAKHSANSASIHLTTPQLPPSSHFLTRTCTYRAAYTDMHF